MKKQLQQFKKNKKGFTLVELIIVIAIIAVLAAVLAPQYIRYLEKSRAATDENTVQEIQHNVEIAVADEAIYTKVDSDTKVAVSKTGYTVSGTGKNDLQTELNKTIASADVKFKSKEYDSQTYTISMVKSEDGIKVSGKWDTTPAAPAQP